jgi:hypothetical protein
VPYVSELTGGPSAATESIDAAPEPLIGRGGIPSSMGPIAACSGVRSIRRALKPLRATRTPISLVGGPACEYHQRYVAR